ncbi:hypothetical protein AKG39_12005 [Acetobacterium bakii]|uniref:DUF948 domain-containing protein n=1 Tax=Acetobacterium bakii TaxID=52689 RepID=A0A0L6TYN5_9FIRM|nr:DUF948 domain-containing protein [Acetobacterium bakii]KNZ41343.1 hypothetical protein AKG39_12005 [Acetobacterium bakii]
MITLDFSLWELGIFLVGIAFIIGSVYLVKLFKSLSLTLDTTTKLMEDNRLVLRSIMSNADEITKSSANVVDKASLMVNEVEQSVSTIKQDVIDPLVSTITILANLLSRLKSFDFRNKKAK